MIAGFHGLPQKPVNHLPTISLLFASFVMMLTSIYAAPLRQREPGRRLPRAWRQVETIHARTTPDSCRAASRKALSLARATGLSGALKIDADSPLQHTG